MIVQCVLLLAAVIFLGEGETSSSNDAPTANSNSSEPATTVSNSNGSETGERAPLPRVIVYSSRLRSFSGHVLEEDSEMIRIRKIDGTEDRFDKSLLITIARLHDVEEPVHAAVLLNDGSRKEGMLELDSFDAVHLRIYNTLHRYPREQVRLVKILPSFEEELAWIRSRLDTDDPKEHLEFCKWLIRQDKLVEARDELNQLIERHQSALAMRELRKVEASLAIREDSEKAGSSEGDEQDEQSPMPPLVTESDVNLIRVYEIDLENPPKMRIPKSTIEALIDQYGASSLIPSDEKSRKAMLDYPPQDILEIMFQLRARNLYNEVEVLTEPDSLKNFRKRIHDNWLLNRCGSRACHGGPPERAGRFRLHQMSRLDDQVRASNLLTLNRLEIDGHRMLDWSEPEKSLLYQYALPRQKATMPHPEVNGWKPIFTPGARTLKRAYQEWVDGMMSHHHKDWPVAYTPWSPPEQVDLPPIPAETPQETR
ncbi:MAG: hypothetical protein CMJ40_10845 [Phycisphaerae bacterium]|nr:hypothetical protein [Phycisphaerae bacterium]